MVRLIDLSHPWGPDTPSFPGQDPATVHKTHEIGVAGNQTFMQRYEMSMHSAYCTSMRKTMQFQEGMIWRRSR